MDAKTLLRKDFATVVSCVNCNLNLAQVATHFNVVSVKHSLINMIKKRMYNLRFPEIE